MKYRVRLDMSFDSESDARSLLDDARTAMGKGVSINEGSASEETSFCNLELCGHDENPPIPCKVIESWGNKD